MSAKTTNTEFSAENRPAQALNANQPAGNLALTPLVRDLTVLALILN